MATPDPAAEDAPADDNAVPEKSAYRAALLAIRGEISDGQHAMLRAHATADGQRLTATELAEAAGYATHSSANLHYGKLGKTLGEQLGFTPPMSRKGGGPVWTNVLATGDEDAAAVSAADFVWTMRPPLYDALMDLPWGIRPPTAG